MAFDFEKFGQEATQAPQTNQGGFNFESFGTQEEPIDIKSESEISKELSRIYTQNSRLLRDAVKLPDEDPRKQQILGLVRTNRDKAKELESQKPKSFLEKATDVATSIFPGKRIGEALGTRIAELSVPEEQKQFVRQIPGANPTGSQIAGDVLQAGAMFAPIGTATGLASKVVGKTLGGIAAGAGAGYLADVGTGLKEGKTLDESLTPGLGTAIGAGIPGAGALARGVGRVTGEIAGKATGAGYGAIKQGIQSVAKGGEEANAFYSALRGGTTPEKLVSEAKNALSQIEANRTSDYVSRLAEIAPSTKTYDISPIIKKIDSGLKNFGVKVAEDGTLDFSRSPIRFNKQAQDDIKTIFQEMQGFGSRPGDRTAIGIDSLKRAFGDLYTESSQARAFVQSVKGEVRKVLSDVPGYDVLTANYDNSTELIKEIQRGLSLGDKASMDTAYKKLISALRQNNEFRKQLVDELNAVSGANLTSKIAGQQLSEILPRGLAGVGAGAGAIGGGVLGIPLLPLLSGLVIASPRVVGEVAGALGIGVRGLNVLKNLFKQGGKLTAPGDVVLDRIKKTEFPQPGASIKIIRDSNPLLQEARKYKSAEEFVKAQFSKKPEYGMGHRPSWDGTPPAHNLLEGDMLPRDVYTHPDFSIASGAIRRGDKAANESWEALQKIRGNPEAEITIYRAGAKNELNVGDWITFSKEYARQSVEGAEKVHSFKVKAKDALFAGDDINEFGYYPKSQLTDIWKEANKKK